jgi:uncharacterized protein (TIGR02646 family)
MRAIHKGREPISLTQHRASSHASFNNYADKDSLRSSLTAEQRGLCCYCLSRIPGASGMKVEHWHSQANYPDEQLDYDNLLGACLGNEGQPPSRQHCDTRKGDRDLWRNPANPSHRIEDFVRFEGDGRITSDNAEFDLQINEVLNLNEPLLKRNRKATLDAFKEALDKRGNSPATRQRWLRDWNGESSVGELRPFCQVVVYWLRRRPI